MLYNRHKQEGIFWTMYFAMIFLPLINLIFLLAILMEDPLKIHKDTKRKILICYVLYYIVMYLFVFHLPTTPPVGSR